MSGRGTDLAIVPGMTGRSPGEDGALQRRARWVEKSIAPADLVQPGLPSGAARQMKAYLLSVVDIIIQITLL